MKKGFSTLDNPSHKGNTDTWLTPLYLIEALGANFDYDPCGFSGHNTARELCTLPSDGLNNPWHGRVWLNPPYSEASVWLDKLAEHGNGVALVFSRTDTRWAQKHMRIANQVFFIKGRIKFLDSNFKTSTNAGHGNMFLAYGPRQDFSKIHGMEFKK